LAGWEFDEVVTSGCDTRPMPKKAPAKSGPTKSDVIRSMPNASAADIIKKAKTLGLKLTANHVYAVRAIDKRRGKPSRASAASPSIDAKSSKRSSSKTAFIRGFSADLPAAKVVEEAKRAGVKISKEYVYRVRALAKPSLGSGRRGLGRGRGGSGSHAGSEQRLTSLALEIGLLRAVALLDRVRARLAN
jgi:hypothetical protein